MNRPLYPIPYSVVRSLLDVARCTSGVVWCTDQDAEGCDPEPPADTARNSAVPSDSS